MLTRSATFSDDILYKKSCPETFGTSFVPVPTQAPKYPESFFKHLQPFKFEFTNGQRPTTAREPAAAQITFPLESALASSRRALAPKTFSKLFESLPFESNRSITNQTERTVPPALTAHFLPWYLCSIYERYVQ